MEGNVNQATRRRPHVAVAGVPKPSFEISSHFFRRVDQGKRDMEKEMKSSRTATTGVTRKGLEEVVAGRRRRRRDEQDACCRRRVGGGFGGRLEASTLSLRLESHGSRTPHWSDQQSITHPVTFFLLSSFIHWTIPPLALPPLTSHLHPSSPSRPRFFFFCRPNLSLSCLPYFFSPCPVARELNFVILFRSSLKITFDLLTWFTAIARGRPFFSQSVCPQSPAGQ